MALRKLDVRGCRSVFINQVEGPQLTCPQLEDPQSVRLEGCLMNALLSNMLPSMQERAASDLSEMVAQSSQSELTAAGALSPLVKLLMKPEASEDLQEAAVWALSKLAEGHDHNKTAIAAAAGAIPALVQLLGPKSAADVQAVASRALSNLAFGRADIQAAIIATCAIPSLELLLESDTRTVRVEAAGALRNLV
jgi:hypothetical protein